MEWLNVLIERGMDLFKWWATVAPWERALRVRAGKHVHEFGPGIHLRVPYLDRFYTQTVRLRTVDVMAQTVTTKDGHALTVSGVVRYKIINLTKLYESLHSPDDTLADLASSYVAQYVSSRTKGEVDAESLSIFVREMLDLNRYGLGRGDFNVTDFAFVRTYRLLQQQRTRNYYSPVETESYSA